MKPKKTQAKRTAKPATDAVAPEALKAVRRNLVDIYQDPANARSHDEKNLASIMGSLRQFGQVEPLVVQKSSGRIIGGNGRYMAMMQLGWESASIVEIDIDDLHAMALGIALNRTAELATWDLPVLEKILTTLRDDAFALEGIGFDDDDLKRFIHTEDSTLTTNADGSTEIDENDFQNFAHTCPRCGFEFDKAALERREPAPE